MKLYRVPIRGGVAGGIGTEEDGGYDLDILGAVEVAADNEEEAKDRALMFAHGELSEPHNVAFLAMPGTGEDVTFEVDESRAIEVVGEIP